MKKWLLILLILCFASTVFSQEVIVVKKKEAACGSVGSEETGVTVVSYGTLADNFHYFAGSFLATASGTIHEVQVQLRDAGTPPQVTVLYLCTSDGGTPPAPTTTCTAADNTTGPPGGSFVWIAFEFAAGYAVTNGTQYFIRGYTSGADDSNYYFTQRLNTGTQQTSRSTDGTTWTSLDQSSQINFRATTCTDW